MKLCVGCYMGTGKLPTLHAIKGGPYSRKLSISS